MQKCFFLNYGLLLWTIFPDISIILNYIENLLKNVLTNKRLETAKLN